MASHVTLPVKTMLPAECSSTRPVLADGSEATPCNQEEMTETHSHWSRLSTSTTGEHDIHRERNKEKLDPNKTHDRSPPHNPENIGNSLDFTEKRSPRFAPT